MPSPHAHDETDGTRRRVTVGLPVYNDAERLYTSVPTVFEQSYDGPVRLLVVDDGSTDHTREVLAELAERYEGIEVLAHERNLGR
ncbi:MAG: glycosyltransferase family 2 protein, partial [Actinomycetota bacterium]